VASHDGSFTAVLSEAPRTASRPALTTQAMAPTRKRRTKMRVTYLIFCAVLVVALAGAYTKGADVAKEPHVASNPGSSHAKQMTPDTKETRGPAI
jgi:hypothetical protein